MVPEDGCGGAGGTGDGERSPDAPEPRRQVRRDKGQVQLTERDLWALQWIGAQYAVRVDQLQVLLGRVPQGTLQVAGQLAPTTTRHIVQRWVRAGVIGYQKILVQEPGWIWLTRAGLLTAGLPYRPYVPGAAGLRHLYWVNQARLRTEDRRPEAHWVSERALWYQAEAARTLPEAGAPRQVPDGQVELDGRTVIAVEVELSVKKSERLKVIVSDRVRHYAGVWYFVTPQTRAAVRSVVAQLDPQAQSKVRLIDLGG